MSQPSSSRHSVSSLRDLAKQMLAKYLQQKTQPVQESFLFKNQHFVGVRFSVGPFRFQWLESDNAATIFRNERLLETVSTDAAHEVRRAA